MASETGTGVGDVEEGQIKKVKKSDSSCSGVLPKYENGMFICIYIYICLHTHILES
jgi:hypothetical protein